MNAELIRWLETANDGLCEEACQATRQEIESHYSDALKSYLAAGRSQAEARLVAMADLGDPREANRRFKKTHLTIKEARHASGLLRPPKRRAMWLPFLVVISLAGLSAWLYRRPAVLSIAALLPIFLWIMNRARGPLRRRLTVRAAIVFTILAVVIGGATTGVLWWILTGDMTADRLRTTWPGMIGGSLGFALFAWKTYGPLWRKAGTRRLKA
jgi:hypothetical protein